MKHLSGAPFYGRLLALPTNIRLGWKRNVSDKHSSLLRKFVKYGQKSFITLGPGVKVIKLFFLSLVMWQSKIDCLSLAVFLGLVKYNHRAVHT